jgi:outer membrane protein assembly factor BamD (BamD/ComL family)
MPHRLIFRFCLPLATLWLVSCGSKYDVPVLAGDTRAASAEAEALFQQARSADDSGKTKRAIKLYDRTATRYPFASSAGQARFRQAQLLEQEGQITKSFEAYDQFIEQHPASSLYGTALARQAAMAQSAAEGDVKSSFLGLKTRLSLEKTTEMLAKVSERAPKSRTAAKARFTAGELYQSKMKSREAIAAFRELVREQPDSPEAPEALFRVGLILMEEAERGNQNQSNNELAREAFNDYLIQYPGHSRNAEARNMIASLSGREMESSLAIAEFYRKTDRPESARIYYRDIVKRAGPGKTRDTAAQRLKELGE